MVGSREDLKIRTIEKERKKEYDLTKKQEIQNGTLR